MRHRISGAVRGAGTLLRLASAVTSDEAHALRLAVLIREKHQRTPQSKLSRRPVTTWVAQAKNE